MAAATARKRAWVARGAGVLAVASLSLGGCVFVSGNVNPFSRRAQPLEEHTISGAGKDKILLLDISGPITSEERSGALGIGAEQSTVDRVASELRRAAEDERVKALLVRINSPGGTVTASDVVYGALMRFKEERGVPVVAHLMDLATSGGYYVALAADEIVAQPTVVTGSIGVLFTGVSVEGLLGKIGVADQTIKTGSKKDIGSPLRRMTDEERRLLESLLEEMRERFVGLVHERRPELTEEMAAKLDDGRVFSAGQALRGNLIDRVGDLQDAIEAAEARAGLTTARVVLYRRGDEFAESIYSRAAVSPPQVNLVRFDLGPLFHTPQFLYLWMP
jgi:protease-4